MDVLDFLRADGSIVVNKKLAKQIGLNETVVYSELVSLYKYWSNREKLTEDGWFFCTYENLEENTTIPERTASRVVNRLAKLGLIEKKRMGLPAKTYYKITNGIYDLFVDINNENKISQNGRTDNINVSDVKNDNKPRHDQISQNGRTRSAILAEPDQPKWQGNNTRINNTNLIIEEEEEKNKNIPENNSFHDLKNYLPMMKDVFDENDINEIIKYLLEYNCYHFIGKDIKASFKKTKDNINTVDIPTMYFAKVLSNEVKKARITSVRNAELEQQREQASNRDTSFYFDWLKEG